MKADEFAAKGNASDIGECPSGQASGQAELSSSVDGRCEYGFSADAAFHTALAHAGRVNSAASTDENILHDLLDSLPCGVCCVHIDDGFPIIYANTFFFNMLGYSPEQARVEGFHRASFVVYQADFLTLQQAVRENLEAEYTLFGLEHRFVHRSGKVLWGLVCCRFDPARPDRLMCMLLDITLRKSMEEQLRIREEEIRIALSHAAKDIAIYDLDAKILYRRGETAFLHGLPEVIHDVPESILAGEYIMSESIDAYREFFRSMRQGVAEGSLTLKVRGKEKPEWHRADYTLIFTSEGHPQRSVISIEDVTEQREKELAYQKWSQFFKSERADSVAYHEFNLTQNIYDGNDCRSYEVVPEYMTSYSDSLKYVTARYIHPEDAAEFLAVFNREKLLLNYSAGRREVYLEHRRVNPGENTYFWAAGMAQLLADPYTTDVKAFVLMKNIDEQKKKELAIKRMLELDALTGLLNRGTLVERISDTLRQSSPTMRHAFIMLDIDNFKRLNDSYGHQFGDLVLKEVAMALKDAQRKQDFCGRLGGDEFIVFLTDIPAGFDLENRLALLCRAAAKTYSGDITTSGSLGLARYPDDGNLFSDLYHKADIALYEAKKLGRNRFMVYQPSMGG